MELTEIIKNEIRSYFSENLAFLPSAIRSPPLNSAERMMCIKEISAFMVANVEKQNIKL